MRKMLVIAWAAPLLLIGAAYPETPKAGSDKAEGVQAVAVAPVTYRPCRPGPGDDRCIQLYERGVRASYARWLRQHDATEAPTQVASRTERPRTRVAMGGPVEARGERPDPRHSEAGHRCVESDLPVGETRGM